MPEATLTLTIPDDVWIGDLTRAFPAASFQVLAALPGDRTGVGLANVTAADPKSVLGRLDDYDAVVDVEVLERRGGRALVQLETTRPLLLEPARLSGIPLEMPFTVQDGEVVWELTASRDRLSALGDQLARFGIPFTVDSIYREFSSSKLLTEQQWELLAAAVREGYYDTPRTCTQEELAATVGVAKSTCSETLHRAEERIVKQFVADTDTGPDSESPPVVAEG